jgi:hypothetical protein
MGAAFYRVLQLVTVTLIPAIFHILIFLFTFEYA